MAPCLHETTRSDLKHKYRNQSTSRTTTPSPSPTRQSRFRRPRLSSYYEQTGSKQGQCIYGYMHASYMGICMQTSWPCKQSGATRIHVHAYTLLIRPRLLLTRGDARQPLTPVDYGIRSTRGKAGKDVRQHYHEADASKQGQVCMHIRMPCSSTSISKSQA